MAEENLNEIVLTPTLSNWLAIIRSCEQSGESLKSYAARKGLSIHSLYQAKRSLRAKGILQPPVDRTANRKVPTKRLATVPRFAEVIQRSGLIISLRPKREPATNARARSAHSR